MKRLSQAVLLTAGLTVPLAPQAQAAPKPPPAPNAPKAAVAPGVHTAVRTVKLPTGDRVRVQDGTVVGIDPGPGRDHIAFQQVGRGRDLTVLPSDAAQRKLDPNLFRIGGAPAPVRRAAAADHGLKVEVLDRQGNPLPAMATVTSRDDPEFGMWGVGPGEELRVPDGRYAVHVTVGEHGREGPYLVLAAPEVRVDKDMTVTLDGRRARRVKVGVARPTARATLWEVQMNVKAPPGAGYPYSGSTAILPEGAEVYADVIAPPSDFVFTARGTFQEPLIRVDVEGDSPFPVDVSYARDEDGQSSPPLLGVLGLKAVDGGAGAPDDLKDVTGALVVLDPSTGDTPLPERVQNAAKAGGRAVLLAGTGKVPSYSGELALPTMVASGEAGERLRRLTETAPVPVTTHGIEASPYNYNVVHPTIGGMPDNPVYQDRDEDLATGHITYRGAGAARTAILSGGADLGDLEFGNFAEQIRIPSVRTEYVSAAPGLTFSRVLIGDGDGTPEEFSGSQGYQPGERFTDTMFKGVLGPWLSSAPEPMKGTTRPAWVFRKGDTIDVKVPTFTDDGPGHYGANYAYTEQSAGATRLYRNGALLGETTEPGTGAFKVPAEAGAYRLDVEAKVGDPQWQATTGVRTSWTFNSKGDGSTTTLPLMAVRFSPSLNDLNQGPAGSEVSIPVRVEHQAGASSTGPVVSFTAKASDDDGAHWRTLPVVREGDHWVVRVHNPAKGAVTLRAFARDGSGNTVDETLTHAYTVR
ncbi:PA domain-containing protein [Actinomadura oligospora]|uniref:PA domain-containing protein n=1 Tax=Actinomadura oligospora TaxID=111804 RepID=UPI00047C87B0|nr:PA domain-containing protein [Actinomadura oligospora]